MQSLCLIYMIPDSSQYMGTTVHACVICFFSASRWLACFLSKIPMLFIGYKQSVTNLISFLRQL